MAQPLPSWNLHDLVRNPQKDYVRLTDTIHTKISALEAQRKDLTPKITEARFLKIWDQYANVTEDITKLRAFAFLWFAENTKHQTARAFDNQVRNRLTEFSNRLVFLDLWWQSLPAPRSARLTKAAERYRYHLETLTRYTPYTLSEKEEQILATKSSTGKQALESLYGIATNGFEFHPRVKGRTLRLTREQLMSYVRHPLASIRRTAYQELFSVYKENRNVLGEIYKNIVQDWGNEGIKLRHYASPMAVRNVANDIPDQAVDALLEACRSGASVFQQYFKLKARLLKLKTFQRYDLYAPYAGTKTRIPFHRAEQIVIQSYKSFSPNLASLAQRVMKERHLDAAIRPGKMGGAFCYSVLPKETPYVLVNYTGETRDVSTLAHELGHAVHGMLAGEHPIFTFHSALPLAETASLFGEQLLSDALLQEERNKQVRISLLINQLDDAYATILRQAYFVAFEKEAHTLVAQGATVDELARTYLRLLQEQFGRAVKVGEEFQWEWLAIPHIFSSPFYCYAYSFGNLLVFSLFQQYKKEGAPFVPKYLQLLSGGGSANPQALLTPLGVDISSSSFWEGGFSRIRDLIKELEQVMP
ncbi:MAG: M3 family oligoendopeptidase [Nitrospirales bacterium]